MDAAEGGGVPFEGMGHFWLYIFNTISPNQGLKKAWACNMRAAADTPSQNSQRLLPMVDAGRLHAGEPHLGRRGFWLRLLRMLFPPIPHQNPRILIPCSTGLAAAYRTLTAVAAAALEELRRPQCGAAPQLAPSSTRMLMVEKWVVQSKPGAGAQGARAVRSSAAHSKRANGGTAGGGFRSSRVLFEVAQCMY